MRTLYLSLCCTTMLATAPAFGLETLPQLQLAQSYQQQGMLSAFWISEKLDGVRAFWDGKQLRSRSGQWTVVLGQSGGNESEGIIYHSPFTSSQQPVVSLYSIIYTLYSLLYNL